MYSEQLNLFLSLDKVPLGNMVFALPFVPGHSPMRVTDIVGLVCISIGLAGFRYSSTQYYNAICLPFCSRSTSSLCTRCSLEILCCSGCGGLIV